MLLKLLSKFDKVIIAGDTNLCAKDEKYLNYLEFNDIYNDKKDYTYDGKLNPFIKNKIRSRIDRFLVKGNINCIFELEKEYIISDHFCIKLLII